MQFFYVIKPCGAVLQYKRASKAQRVAALYSAKVTQSDQLTPAQHEAVQVMYF